MYILNNFFENKKEREKLETMKFKLLKEIHTTVNQIAQTELWFQMEIDENLIDSCIYQRELLYSRYRHLIQEAKYHNIQIQPNYLILSTKEN